jgi:hypothetical protein
VEIALKEQNLMKELSKINDGKISDFEEKIRFEELLKVKDQEIEELRDSINVLKLRSKSQPDDVNRKKTQICFYCQKQGHIKSECRKFHWDNNQNSKRYAFTTRRELKYVPNHRGARRFDNKNTEAQKHAQDHFLG